MTPLNREHRRGLTLIEVALAVTILAMMTTITWGSIGRSFDAYETVTAIDQRYHNVRIAMNRVARELSMAFLASPRRSRGKELMWETIFQSKLEGDFQTIHFTAFAHHILRADAKESDQCEISYFGDRDQDDASQYNLMRREDPRLDQDPDKGGRVDILAYDVKSFKMRFYDFKDQDWTDEWDTEDQEFAGRLPTIVEITMVVEDEERQELKFVTKTRIHLTKELGTI